MSLSGIVRAAVSAAGVLALGLLLALVVVVATSFPAFLVLVRNTPDAAWLGPALPAPDIERTVQATPGDPSQSGAIYRPVGSGARRGVVLVNGAEVPGGWRDPTIETFARSLAALGLAVYVPDLPGFEQGILSRRSLAALKEDIRWFAGSAHSAGAVSLVGVCVGGPLGILTASEPSTAPFVRGAIAIDPYADLRTVVRVATTGRGPGLDGRDEPFDMVTWIRADVVRGIAASVGDEGSRQPILAALDSSPTGDPLAAYRRQPPPADLSPTAAAWWRLLANTSAADFERLYGELPAEARSELQALSPASVMDRLQVPVLIAAPFHDFAFPAGEATRLQQANPERVRLTRTAALDHVTPSVSPALVAGYWRLWRFSAQGVNLLL